MSRISSLLQADFSEDGGYSLVIWGDQAITGGDVNGLQMNMMQANAIPRHLACHTEERDMVIRLYYDISQKRVLRNILQGHRLKTGELINILTNILQVLENAADYMLDGANYVLDSQFIFSGNSPDDIYLVYLPITQTGLGTSKERVRGLAMELAQYMDEGHKTQLISIINTLDAHHPEEYVKQMKNQLNRVALSGVQPSPVKNQGPAAKPPGIPAGNPSVGANPVQVPQQPHRSQSAPAPTPPKPVFPPPPVKPMPNAPVKTEHLSERARIIIGSIGVLAAAYVWKTYMDYPSEGFLYLAIGLSVLILDAIYVAFSFWGTRTSATQAKPSQVVVNRMAQPPVAPPPLRPVQPQTPVDPQQYYNDLANKTALIGNRAPDTSILEATQQLAASRDEPLSVYLEKRNGNQVQKIFIETDSFAIGRNAKEVQHVEESTEVSRLHCEIIRADEGWSIKDRDSKNFTYLNGQKLIPNKLYPLTSGDFIRVANIEYTFIIGPGRNA